MILQKTENQIKSNKYLVRFIGVFGVILFVIPSIIGGLVIKDYSFLSQYISESFAIDTTYGLYLRLFGYIPSGILITIFYVLVIKLYPDFKILRIGFLGLAIFYGLGNIMVAVFPCDSGCNPELIDSSVSQILHNASALLTYLFVPISILMIGFELRKIDRFKSLSNSAVLFGFISLIFVFQLLSNPLSDLKGVHQRIIESSFAIWTILCAVSIKNGAGMQGSN